MTAPEFGAVKFGNTRYFPPPSLVLFDGDVKEHLAGHIQCWEADDSGLSWYSSLCDMLKKVAEFFHQRSRLGQRER